MPSLPRPIPASFSRARSAHDSMPGLALGRGIFALLGCEPDEGASPGSSGTDAGSTAATAIGVLIDGVHGVMKAGAVISP